MEPLILAIDQGTTGTTAMTFNNEGHSIKRTYAEVQQIYPQPGWVEHDAMAIWEDVKNLINETIDDPSAVKGIGITNQRETAVIWDRYSGRPIHHAIVWQCRRTADLCKNLKPAAPLIRKKTGLPIDAYFSGTKIKWMLEHVPGAWQKAQRGDLLFGTIDSWLIWKLTNGKHHVTDYSNASRTLLFNIHEKVWDSDLLDILEIPTTLLLPEIVPSSGVCGYTDKTALWGKGSPSLASLATNKPLFLAKIASHQDQQKIPTVRAVS